MSLTGAPLTVAAFIVVIGVLIFVHEAGHFFAAKAVGIQVLRFSLGFGRPLLAWRWGETEYWISWLPIGGYVKMAGLEDEGLSGELEGGKSETAVDPARAFDRQPLWSRIVVIVAGVTMNMVFAFAVYSGLAYRGSLASDLLATTRVDSIQVASLPPAAAPLAALHRGDRITTINGDSVTNWPQLLEILYAAESPIRITVAGRATPIVLTLDRADTLARVQAVRSLNVFLPPVVQVVTPGGAGARGDLRAGDRILKVNDDTVISWADFTRVIRSHPSEPVSILAERAGQRVAVTVVPDRRQDNSSDTSATHPYGFLDIKGGLPPGPPPGLIGALRAGWREGTARAGQVAGLLGQLLTGRASMRDLGGPILIGQVSGQAARAGLPYYLSFMAFLSVNLAVLNLFPIPILDGGQLVFLVAEGVRRKPLPLKLRLRLSQIGFAILIVLMLIVVSNDLLRVFHH